MIVFYLFLKMVFLVIRKYELRYNSYDCEDTTSILGIYTSKIKAEERLKQEGKNEPLFKHQISSIIFIKEIEIDVDVDVDLLK